MSNISDNKEPELELDSSHTSNGCPNQQDKYIENLSNSSVSKGNYLYANSINVQDFDPKILHEIVGGVIAIVAPTGAGKTVLLKHLLSMIHKEYDQIMMFSGTAKLQKVYDFFPRSMISDHFDEEKLLNMWQKQIKDFEESKNPSEPYHLGSRRPKKKLEKCMVILDDVIHDKEYIKSKAILEVATGGRHLNILVILLSQYITKIKPVIRANIRLAISFQLTQKREREKFIEEFLSLENNQIGDILFRKITGVKYQSIVVCIHRVGDSTEKKVFKFIADENSKIYMQDTEDSTPRMQKLKNHKVQQVVGKRKV